MNNPFDVNPAYRFGFGASGLGTLTWDVPDEVADAILAEAWTEGFRYYDTSPLYGFGLSELRLGRFLRNKPRDEYLLTEAGRDFLPILAAIGAWGRKYNGKGALTRQIDVETGEPVRPVVIDANTGAPLGTRPLRFEYPD